MKRTLSYFISVVILICCMFVGFSAFASEPDVLTVYPEYDSRILRCFDYSVSVTQSGVTKQLTVYNQNRTEELLKGRTLTPDSERRFCEFAFSGSEVRVDIKVNSSFDSYSILPSAKNFRNEFHDGVISVWLDSPNEYFLVELDDDYNSLLSVFADEPEAYSFDKSDSSVLVLDEAWTQGNNGEEFKVPSGVTTLYIAPGSVLCARLMIKTRGFTVCGHGLILDPYSDIFHTDNKNQAPAYVVTVNAREVTLRDFKVVDAQTFNIVFYDASANAHVEDIKILSSRMCTDGISTTGSDYFTAEHCFIYCGDDAVTFGSGDYGTRFNNCYIGTTCGAIHCSKDIPGDVVLTNTYVFRADEGCVKNWYNVTNPGTLDRTVASVTFDGLDCADVINLPWLFSGRNMGINEKNFHFRNVVVNDVRGSSNILATPTGKAVILTGNSSNYLTTYNYNLDFTNLMIDGVVASSVENVPMNNGFPEENSISVVSDGSFDSATAGKTNYRVNYTYPLSVKIGSHIAEMKTQPVENNGEYYLVYDELCEVLNIPPQSSDYLTYENNVAWISLTAINDHINPAFYDNAHHCIVIENVCDSSVNLAAEKSDTLSRWNEDVAYQSSVTVTDDEQGTAVYLNKASLNAGMHISLTDEIKQNGRGIYKLEFDASAENSIEQTTRIELCFNTTGGKSITETAQISGEWAHYTYLFDTKAYNIEAAQSIYLAFTNTSGANYRIQYKNISFTLTGFDIARGGKTVYVSFVNPVTANTDTLRAYYGTDIAELEIPVNGTACFEGWYTDVELTTPANGLLTCDITLYSKWSEGVLINYCAGGAPYMTQVVKKDYSSVKLLAQPIVEGYCGAGWFYDDALTLPVSAEDVFSQETTLFAGYYRNIFDYSQDDLDAYIAYATHKLSSVASVSADSIPSSGSYNRTAVCAVEGGKTYKVRLNFNLRFRVGAVETLQANKIVENLVIDELDTNGTVTSNEMRELTITAGENETTLLIFYFTSSGAPVDAPIVRKTIGVYDIEQAVQGFTAPEPPTQPTTEELTQPETEEPTQPTTEEPTQPTACSHICHSESVFMRFIYSIARFFWKLFGVNEFCSCGARHW